MKKVLVLGSTGSIGVSTLEVLRKFEKQFEVYALTTNSNIDLLFHQIEIFNPKCVVVKNMEKAEELREIIDKRIDVLGGDEGLIEVTKNGDYDILVSALVGFAGLAPTIESIKRGKRIALANKETLVAAGEMVMQLALKHKSEIIPVDSEHSAIFQCLMGEKVKNIGRLLVTASGGPFLNRTKEELITVTIEEALNHPNWEMGSKITVDSATMMNKGLEVIEAHWLFNLDKDKIEVVVHPQSVIHSMIEFIDKSIKAQLSIPDMKLPIQFALSYPDRWESEFVETDFPLLKELTFYEPDLEKFKCLKLAYQAMEQGGTYPCILNAANEIAVQKFLNGNISFTQIPELIEFSLNGIESKSMIDRETILECDRHTREYSLNFN